MNNKNSRLGELDVFRGIAVLIVLLFHCTMFRKQAEYGFFLGISGVDFFFIISGFVILMSAEQKKPNSFILSRAIRLYPIYWIIASFTFVTRFILDYYESPIPFSRIPVENYLANLTMIQYYLGVPNIDGSYWTLIIELLFYVLIYFALVFQVLKNIVRLGSFLCLIIGVIFMLIQFDIIPNYTAWFPILYHFPLFFIGILFYKIYTKNELVWYYMPLILMCVILQLYLHSYGRATLFMSLGWYAAMLVIYCIFFSLFVFGKLRFIVNKKSTFLGEISYSLYLIHQPLAYGILIPYFVDIIGVPFWIATLFIVLPTVIVLATFTTFYVEKPLHKFLRRKLLRKG